MKITPLAKKLKELRKLNNFSQQRVADELNIIRQTYSHYETGRNHPNSDILYKLSKLYNISVEGLLELSDGLSEYQNKYKELDEINYLNEINFSALSLDEKRAVLYYKQLEEKEQKDLLAFLKLRATKKR